MSRAEKLAEILKKRGLTLAIAESCTGGLLGHILTNAPGCSEWFKGGVIAYSNSVKEEVLGVRGSTLAEHGAVSEETAREMAAGARERFESDVSAAITGIAGPGGGSENKPVGTVFVAAAIADEVTVERLGLEGTRGEIKKASALGAIKALEDLLERQG